MWVGGHGFVVADGESGSVPETGVVERERGRAVVAASPRAGWQRDPMRMPACLPGLASLAMPLVLSARSALQPQALDTNEHSLAAPFHCLLGPALDARTSRPLRLVLEDIRPPRFLTTRSIPMKRESGQEFDVAGGESGGGPEDRMVEPERA